MSQLTTELLIEVGYAAGIGLFVGLEREHHEYTEDLAVGEPPGKSAGPADTAVFGARTFALLCLLGWVSAFGGEHFAWLPPVGLAVVGVLVATQYVLMRGDRDLGLTTEIAAVLTFLLGMLVRFERGLAVVLALAVTLLLLSKPWIRTLVSKLRRVEITSTLQLLVLLAIVLPLLPSEPRDPWDALPPQKIGLFVVLIAGISYVGYFSSRLFGQRRGAGLTGLFGGLTSSTAVTVAMASAARDDASMRRPGQLAVFLANSIMFFRVIVITAILSRALALEIALPMAVMGAVMLGGALWKWRSVGDEPDTTEPEPPELANPFAIVPAIKWGVLLCGVLLLAELAQRAFGDYGLYAAAGASGLADVDPITLAVGKQAGEGGLDLGVGALAITIAVVSNTVVKAGMAAFIGRARFGADVLKVFGAAMAAGLTVAIGAAMM